MTLVIFRAGREVERQGRRERERAFSLFVSVVYGISIVNDFVILDEYRERERNRDRGGGERERTCLFRFTFCSKYVCKYIQCSYSSTLTDSAVDNYLC